MSSNNETPILVASLLITAGLIGGGYLWFTRNGGLDLGNAGNPGTIAPNPDAAENSVPLPAPTGANFSDVPNVPAGTFNYGGSTTWAPVRGTLDPLLQQARPTFRLRYVDPIGAPAGSGTGIRMLLTNQLSFAQSSRSLNPEERQEAQQNGYSLREIPVAIEGLAVAVHPDLAVDGLTLEQLRDIYLGSLTNWSQVGGPNLAIVPVSRTTDGGTVEFFIETVLGGSNLARNVTFARSTTDALRLVSSTPGAIYYASAPEVVEQCTVKPIALGRQAGQLVPPYREPYVPPANCPAQRNQLNAAAFQSGEYPITRRMSVIVREDGQLDQQAGEAYANLLLTDEGQRLLEQAGFVPLR